MFENFSNLIFIAVALAIFIGRTVAQARRNREAEAEKEKAPAPPPRPRVQALHFEDDDDAGYVKKPAAPVRTAKQPIKKPVVKPVSTLKKEIAPPANVEKLFPIKGTARAAVSEQAGFSFKLDHLSPMKQAVVMAEILGPPKGMM